MKKKIQALACAAMLAVGGFNVWTAVDGNGVSDLQVDDIERIAEGESLKDWLVSFGIGNNIDWRKPKLETKWVYNGRGYVMNWYYTDIGGREESVEWYKCKETSASEANPCANIDSQCFKTLPDWDGGKREVLLYGVGGPQECPF